MQVVRCTNRSFVLMLQDEVPERCKSLLKHRLIMHLDIGLKFIIVMSFVDDVIFSYLFIANAISHFYEK